MLYLGQKKVGTTYVKEVHDGLTPGDFAGIEIINEVPPGTWTCRIGVATQAYDVSGNTAKIFENDDLASFQLSADASQYDHIDYKAGGNTYVCMRVTTDAFHEEMTIIATDTSYHTLQIDATQRFYVGPSNTFYIYVTFRVPENANIISLMLNNY